MKCSTCGATLSKNSQFCSSCGNKVIQDDPKTRFSRPPEKYQGPQKLYRSRKNRIIGGVCGGLGEYFDIDPTIIRLLWVLFTLVAGGGILAYLIMLVIIPESPYDPWAEP